MKNKLEKVPDDIAPCIKAFFKSHPFMLGVLIAFINKYGAIALAGVLEETVDKGF